MAIPAAVLSVDVQARGIDRVSRQLNDLHREAQKANVGMSSIEAQSKQTAAATSELEKRFTHLDRTLGDFNREATAAGNVIKLLKFPTMIAAVGTAAQGVGALAAGFVSLTSAMAPVAGLAAGAAGGFVAMGQAVGVVKLAFSDVQKALAGNKRALDALTPAQKTFVNQLKEQQKEVKGLKQAAAAGLFPGLNRALTDLQPLFGRLRPVIGATGQALGDLAQQAAKSVSSWGADLTSLGRNNIVVLRNVGAGAISLANAFRDLLVAAEPLTRWMSAQFVTWAKFIQNQVHAGRESGRLTAFFKLAQQTAIQLGRILANLGITIFNIGKSAAPAGRVLLTMIEDVTKKWRTFTGTAEGQNAMKAYFDAALPSIRALGGLVGDLSGALFRISQGPGFAQLVNQLRGVVPILEQVVISTTTAFGPVVVDAIVQMVRLFAEFAAPSGPLFIAAKLIAQVAGSLADIFQQNPFLTHMIGELIGLFAAWEAFSAVFGSLGQGVMKFVGVWVKLQQSAQGATKQQQAATDAANVAGTEGAASVQRLVGAWTGVGRAAQEAAAKQEAAGVGRTTGVSFGKGGIFQPALGAGALAAEEQAAEQATVSRFSGLTQKLGSVAARAMSGVGIAIGGIVATSIAATIVGGGAGKWIAAIGTGGSLGAALGQVFGPGGAVAGAVLGSFGGAITKWISDNASKEGRDWATKYNQGVRAIGTPTAPAIAPLPAARQRQLQDLETAARTQARDAQMVLDRAARPTAFGKTSIGKPSPQEVYQAGRDLADAYSKIAWSAQQVFRERLSQPGVIKTVPGFIRDTISSLSGLPGAARNQAAASILSFASELTAKGELPKNATQRVLTAIESLLPGFQAYMAGQGLTTSKTITDAFDLKGASSNFANTLLEMRSKYADFGGQLGTTNDKISGNFQQVWADIQTRTHSKSKEVRDDALNDAKTTSAAWKRWLDAMVADTTSHWANISDAIKTNSGGAARAAMTAFNNIAGSIQAAMASGAVSTALGAKTINDALNALLKAYGEKPINIVGLTAGQLKNFNPQAYTGGAGTTTLHQGGLQHGGLIQIGQTGQRGQDNIALNVAGTPIAVGAGEQIAVFNHHQQRVANAALAPIGGLSGLFSKVNRPHAMASGGFVPGFAQGGTFSEGELEGLWTGAGGPANLASLAAAIALAESRGDVHAIGPRTPFGSALGLWQILGQVVPGNIFDPHINALNAVSKWRSAHGFSPWTTYTSGAYKAFLGAAGAAVAGGGGPIPIPTIPSPKVTGDNTVATIVRAALGLMANAANSLAQKAIGPLGGGGGAGSATGLTAQVQAALSFARAHGWRGSVVSGFRTYAQQKAIWDAGIRPAAVPGTSLHERGLAVDVSDIPDFARAMAMAPAGIRLYSRVPGDPEHFSTTGHQRGGLVKMAGAFANGGIVSASSPTMAVFGENGPETAMFMPGFQRGLAPGSGAAGQAVRRAAQHLFHPPRPPAVPSLFGKTLSQWWAPQPGEILKNDLWMTFFDLGDIGGKFNRANSLINTLEPRVTELINRAQQNESLESYNFWTDPPSHVDASGATIQPASFIDPNNPDLRRRSARVQQIYDWYQQRIDYLREAIALIKTVRELINAAIERRRKEIRRLQEIVNRNVQSLMGRDGLIAQLHKEQAKTAPRGTTGQALKDWTAGHQASVKKIQDQITTLEDQNARIGGSKDALGSSGHIADITWRIGKLQENQRSLDQWQQGAEGFGAGGTLQEALFGQASAQRELDTLVPPYTGIAGSPNFPAQTTTAGPTNFAALLQQIQFAAAQLRTLQAVALPNMPLPVGPVGIVPGLGGPTGRAMPPYGGSYQFGGVIPGMTGEARTIIAHGGEVVGPAGHEVHIHFAPGTEWLSDFVQVQIQQSGRQDTRTASRQLPGSRM